MDLAEAKPLTLVSFKLILVNLQNFFFNVH
jgi:hypothetical protein